METKNVPLEELRSIVGESYVREATAEDAVEGVDRRFDQVVEVRLVTPSLVLTEQELPST